MLEQDTPLWFYLLKEAAGEVKGERLGPVGARIVAEVLIGLLKGDPQSYLNAGADLEAGGSSSGVQGGEFTLEDLQVSPWSGQTENRPSQKCGERGKHRDQLVFWSSSACLSIRTVATIGVGRNRVRLTPVGWARLSTHLWGREVLHVSPKTR